MVQPGRRFFYGTEGDDPEGDEEQAKLPVGNPQPLSHFVVKHAFAGAVGLEPFAVDDQLRDGALTGAADDFVGSAGGSFDIDIGVGKVVLFEKAPGSPAVGAPEGGVEDDVGRFQSLRVSKQDSNRKGR